MTIIMLVLQVALFTSIFCLVPNVDGYVHYGVESDVDSEVPDDGEVIRIHHSHGHRSSSSSSESDSSADSNSSSDSSSDSGSSSGSSFGSSSDSSFDSSSSSGPDSSFSSSSESSSSSSDFDSSSESDEDYDEILIIQFKAFGVPVNVNLKRVNSQLAGTKTPVWLAQRSPNGNVTFTRAGSNVLEKSFRLYQDRQTQSTVMLLRDLDGVAHFTGILAGHRIRPYSYGRKSKRSITRRSADGLYTISDYHYVTRYSRKRREAAVSELADRFKRDTADSGTIYPEILVASDYDIGFTSTNTPEFYEHLIYLLAFFNGVDLLFEDIENPDVRLHIAGIVVAATHDAVPYIHDNIAPDGHIEAKKAVAESGSFYADNVDPNDLPAGSYDVVITLTNSYICSKYESTICTKLINGVSTIHPVCENNYPVVNMSAIIRDDSAFSGTRIAGHELGHIFGAGHDGVAAEGGGDCNFADGYIMSKYNENSTVSLQWSKCSKKAFKEELSKSIAQCLRNPPDWTKDGKVLPPILPSTIKGSSAQCRALGYVKACLVPNICSSLQCTSEPFLLSTGCQKVGVPAAQGSYCGFNRHCINGVCRAR